MSGYHGWGMVYGFQHTLHRTFPRKASSNIGIDVTCHRHGGEILDGIGIRRAAHARTVGFAIYVDVRHEGMAVHQCRKESEQNQSTRLHIDLCERVLNVEFRECMVI